MYARILVAVDDSPGSTRAVAHAIALSKAFAAKLRVLHVVDAGWLVLGQELAIDTGRIATARRNQGARILGLAIEQTSAAGIDAESRLVETDSPGERAADRIVQEAQAWAADLIVLGSHGRSGAQRPFLGRVAEGVARHARVPVVLVQAG
jgi:nucleotide-binding universal stress UspA family protein